MSYSLSGIPGPSSSIIIIILLISYFTSNNKNIIPDPFNKGKTNDFCIVQDNKQIFFLEEDKGIYKTTQVVT